MAYADLEPLDIQHGHLSNVFNQLLASTVNTLTSPLNSLSRALQQHATPSESPKEESAKTN